MVRAAVLESSRTITIQDFPAIEVGPYDGVLRVELAGICGTDYKTFTGSLDYALPLILGHEIVGRIERIGEEAARAWNVQVGDRVAVEGTVPCWACAACRSGSYKMCTSRKNYGTTTPATTPPHLWGAMAEEMYLAPGSIIHKMAEDVPLEAAVVHGVIANAVHWAIERGGMRQGMRVVVRGAGPQGISAAALALSAGAERVALLGRTVDAPRFAVAQSLGVEDTFDVDTIDVAQAIPDHLGGQADLVIDVSGAPNTVNEDVSLLRPEGRLVWGGLAGKDVQSPVAMDAIVWKAVELVGVFTKRASSIEAATRLLNTRSSRIPFENLVTHIYELDRVEQALQDIGGESDIFPLKAAIRP